MPPRIAVRAALFLAFFGLYLFFGRSLAATGVFAHDDALFQSDTWRTANDATEPAADHYRTKVHPLFVLFFNPLGHLLEQGTGSAAVVTVTLTALAGGLCVALAHAVFAAIGLGEVAALALSCLLGFSTSHLLFASIPDTFILTALSFIICTWLALRRPGSLRAFAPAGVFSIGIATTNIAPAALLFAAGVRRGAGLAATVRRTAAAVLLVVAVTAGLALLQKVLYPTSNLFFVPSAVDEEMGYTFIPRSPAAAAKRGASLARHLWVFGIVAPPPIVWVPRETPVPAVSFQRTRRSGRTDTARLSGAGLWAFGPLLAAYGLGLAGIVRGRLWREPVLQALLLGVAGLAGLFYFYGDDLFLYSCNWVFLVLASMAWGLRATAERGARWAAAVAAVLVLLACLAAVSNVRFLLGLLALYRGA